MLKIDIKMQIMDKPESERFLNRLDLRYTIRMSMVSCKQLPDTPTSFRNLSFVVCLECSNKVQDFKNENGCQSQNHNPSQPQWPPWVINVPNLQIYVAKRQQHITHFCSMMGLIEQQWLQSRMHAHFATNGAQIPSEAEDTAQLTLDAD